MNFKRIGRILVCLLLICCILVNLSPLKARATGLEVALPVAGGIVTSPAGVVIGATLVALGLYAAADPEGFENIKNAATDAMEAAGTWIKDGTVELLRMVDELGNASYYVDSGFLEDVFQWSFAENIISSTLPGAKYYPANSNVFSDPYSSDTYDYPIYRIIFDRKSYTDQLLTVCAVAGATLTRVTSSGTKQTFSPSDSGYAISVQIGYFDYDYLVNSGVPVVHESTSYSSNSSVISAFLSGALDGDSEYFSSYDITLGSLPAQTSDLTDGTSARAWSEDFTDRGLKVYGGGSGNNNNDGKWFWKLMLPLTAADLLLMSQADEWSGETPNEFDDYTTVEELEIVSRPEVEFGQGVEFAPVTSPAPDTGGDTGSDTGSESGNQTDYTSWFQKIIKGIEELPSKFESWITDCKTAIEELPSKFADWFNSIIEKLSSIWETLKSIPQTILDGLRNILTELFVPQEDYISDKVTSLRERFSFADSIMETGRAIGDSLSFGDSEPPVIYIHLGDTEGSYNIGGTVPFLDMRWYARYKPTGDVLLSSLIWVFFAWRCFVHAPNIISGIAGDVEAFNIPDGGGMYLSGSPYAGSDFEKPKRGKFERRKNGRR